MHSPPPNRLTDELRDRHGLLAAAEEERLRAPSPESLDAGRDAVDVALAQVESALDALRLSAWPQGASRVQTALFGAVGSTADLVALLIERDEPLELRPRVPLASMPEMIDLFNDQMRFPVDMGMDGWCGASDPLGSWRYAVSAYLDELDHAVACSRIGTTIFAGSPQSNVVPVVAFVAHLFALLLWLQQPPR